KSGRDGRGPREDAVADRVLILGASARAAAASARRAGLEPFAIDLFADADTEQICDCLRCPPDRYPEGLFELAKQAPPMPWMYTGGLENYPELIAELSRERELWGNGSDVLTRVRDPFELSAMLTGSALAHPEPRHPGTLLHQDRRWLRKPSAGSGGFGVRFATPFDQEGPSPGHYFQEFIPGEPFAAVLCAVEGCTIFLGVSRQLIGSPWLHASNFRYAGSLVVPQSRYGPSWYFHIIGHTLKVEAGIRGLFGVDCVFADAPYIVEVNPRYPASAEVIEFATGRPVLASGLEDSTRPTKTVGKAIYYAPHRLTFPVSGPWENSVRHAADVWRRPDFADVPHPGEVIEVGHPVLTILTEADTEAECLSRLQSRAVELDRLFGFPTPEGESCRP
ncbi:MAG TPA: ATP-grasp domain-containing protein, partial [Fimbriiglobus sp.]|nr:ATP-grasp domain-containing protein [Fimbriiglobus sp.]